MLPQRLSTVNESQPNQPNRFWPPLSLLRLTRGVSSRCAVTHFSFSRPVDPFQSPPDGILNDWHEVFMTHWLMTHPPASHLDQDALLRWCRLWVHTHHMRFVFR